MASEQQSTLPVSYIRNMIIHQYQAKREFYSFSNVHRRAIILLHENRNISLSIELFQIMLDSMEFINMQWADISNHTFNTLQKYPPRWMQQHLQKLKILESEEFSDRAYNFKDLIALRIFQKKVQEISESIFKIANSLSMKLFQIQMINTQVQQPQRVLFHDRGWLGLLTVALLHYCTLKQRQGQNFKQVQLSFNKIIQQIFLFSKKSKMTLNHMYKDLKIDFDTDGYNKLLKLIQKQQQIHQEQSYSKCFTVDLSNYKNKDVRLIALKQKFKEIQIYANKWIPHFILIVKSLCRAHKAFCFNFLSEDIFSVEIPQIRNQIIAQLMEDILGKDLSQDKLKTSLNVRQKLEKQQFLDIYSIVTEEYRLFEKKLHNFVNSIKQPFPIRIGPFLRAQCFFSSFQSIRKYLSKILETIAKMEDKNIKVLQILNNLSVQQECYVKVKILFGKVVGEVYIRWLQHKDQYFTKRIQNLLKPKRFTLLSNLFWLDKKLNYKLNMLLQYYRARSEGLQLSLLKNFTRYSNDKIDLNYQFTEKFISSHRYLQKCQKLNKTILSKEIVNQYLLKHRYFALINSQRYIKLTKVQQLNLVIRAASTIEQQYSECIQQLYLNKLKTNRHSPFLDNILILLSMQLGLKQQMKVTDTKSLLIIQQKMLFYQQLLFGDQKVNTGLLLSIASRLKGLDLQLSALQMLHRHQSMLQANEQDVSLEKFMNCKQKSLIYIHFGNSKRSLESLHEMMGIARQIEISPILFICSISTILYTNLKFKRQYEQALTFILHIFDILDSITTKVLNNIIFESYQVFIGQIIEIHSLLGNEHEQSIYQNILNRYRSQKIQNSQLISFLQKNRQSEEIRNLLIVKQSRFSSKIIQIESVINQQQASIFITEKKRIRIHSICANRHLQHCFDFNQLQNYLKGIKKANKQFGLNELGIQKISDRKNTIISFKQQLQSLKALNFYQLVFKKAQASFYLNKMMLTQQPTQEKPSYQQRLKKAQHFYSQGMYRQAAQYYEQVVLYQVPRFQPTKVREYVAMLIECLCKINRIITALFLAETYGITLDQTEN